ncbi:uncharacterized protein LOC108821333 isoform X2 [Raphanus sativus]|uniref:Uncharacterized protein LOC108821333 isoform X2 n=1 Tax=Raphanus sativus TaxID=3726 RepID=A0A9W3DDQ9_RAPSA|nr:uncharacterized protein LOC108821333 isoform X2 [Raphanus sativus]
MHKPLPNQNCYPVLRSKPSQGVGDDVVIKTVAELEVNQTIQSGHFGGASDRGSVQGEYLNNQKDFCHETNFRRSLTHQGITEACKFKKRFSDQEVMNFTSQPIFSAPNGSDPPRFGPYKSNHEAASSEASYYIKESLLGVQSKKNQAQIPIQPEDPLGLLKFPKPVKPTSISESCQTIQFGPTQTYLWKPGDTLSQPEDIQDFIPCTSSQRIRWILLQSHLPYLEQTDINVQQLFSVQTRNVISSYPAMKKIPRMLSYPLKPSRFKKTSRYNIRSSFPFEESINLAKGYFFGAIKAFASKTFISSLFLSFSHF